MKRSTRFLALLLSVSLLLGLFCFNAAAVTTDAYRAAIAELDNATTYTEKWEAYDEANRIYLELTEEQQAEVSGLYAGMEKIGVILRRTDLDAQSFVAQVNGISDIVIGDRMAAIEGAEAKASELDTTHPDIAAALVALAAMKSELEDTIDKCFAFMEAVSAAEQLDLESYTELRAKLDLAASYLDFIDRGYPGVTGAYNSYSSMSSQLAIKEKYTSGVLDKVNEMINAQEYSIRKMLKNEIDNLLISEHYIPDYEGMQEALAEMAQVEEQMKECVVKATRFILAVEAVATAENYREALIGCYAFIEGVDFTVDGAGAAKESFDNMVDTYNSSVRYCNSFMSGN